MNKNRETIMSSRTETDSVTVASDLKSFLNAKDGTNMRNTHPKNTTTKPKRDKFDSSSDDDDDDAQAEIEKLKQMLLMTEMKQRGKMKNLK